jgi:hypothetical protein
MVLAVVGWTLFAPQQGVGSARAQSTTLLTQSGMMSAPVQGNPRGASYFAQKFTVTLTAGQSYIIHLASPNNGDTYLYLTNPAGTQVAMNDDWGKGSDFFNSEISYTAATTGTYTIWCTTFIPGQALSFTLTVTGPGTTPVPPAPVPPGTGIPNTRLAPVPPGLDPLQAELAALVRSGPGLLLVAAA